MRLRRGFHLHLLAAPADRGGQPAGQAADAVAARAHEPAGGRRCSASVARRNEALSGRRWRSWWSARAASEPGEVMGRTRGHKPVNFRLDGAPGDLVRVELLEATSTSFSGEGG